MNEMTNLTLALLAGLSLGAMFFGGLWWTVRRGMSAKHPALWLFGSVMLRMGATLAGFYFVGRGDWTATGGVPGRFHPRTHRRDVDDAATRKSNASAGGGGSCT